MLQHDDDKESQKQNDVGKSQEADLEFQTKLQMQQEMERLQREIDELQRHQTHKSKCSPTSTGITRRIKKKQHDVEENNPVNDFDIESQESSDDGSVYSHSSHHRHRRIKGGKKKHRSRSSRRATNHGGGPVVSYRILLRKIITAILTDLDDETLQREDTEWILIVITLFKEAMLGILIAFAAVSFVLFIDHRFLLHLPTARNFRRATFQLMNDRDTMSTFEESTGLKLVDENEYNSDLTEINNAANKTKMAMNIFESRSSDLISMQEESVKYVKLLPKLTTQLGMDQFCGECIWIYQPRKVTCNARVQQIQKKYGTSKNRAIVFALKNGACTNSGNALYNKARKGILNTNEVLADWETNKQYFCPDCMWDDENEVTCLQRVVYLKEKRDKSINKGAAMAMREPSCWNLHKS